MVSGSRPKAALVALALAATAGSTTHAGSGDHEWRRYGNSRYGYSACYPADLFRPEAEPDAHDGLIFNGPRDVTLSVSGEKAPASDLREVLDLVVKAMDGRVTYRAAGPDWRVASGVARGLTFYSRVIAREGVVAQYILAYPPARSAEYAPVIKRMNACMKIG